MKDTSCTISLLAKFELLARASYKTRLNSFGYNFIWCLLIYTILPTTVHFGVSIPFPKISQAGGIAGTAVDISLFPLDTIKTRLQSSLGFWKAGGFRGIYKGVSSAAIGSFPTGLYFSLWSILSTSKARARLFQHEEKEYCEHKVFVYFENEVGAGVLQF